MPAVKPIVRSLMEAQGIEKYEDLASRIGIAPSTLSNKLRDLEQEPNDPPFVARLAESLGVTASHMAELLASASGPTDYVAHRRLVQRKVVQFSGYNKTYLPEILDLTGKLGDGDIYTLATLFEPMELRDRRLRGSIVDAIRRGARFCYVYGDGADARFRATIDEYDLPEVEGWDRLAQEHNRFLTLLTEDGLTEDGADRVEMVVASDPVLLSPLLKVIALRRAVLGVEETTAFAEARVGSNDAFEPSPHWYPLPRLETQAIHARLADLFR